MKTLLCKPSKKVLALIEIHGSANAAAEAWDIPTSTLMRFLEQGIDAPVPMRIAHATGLPCDDVVVTMEDKR